MKYRSAFLFFMILLICTGCRWDNKDAAPVKSQIFAMDTVMDFTVYGEHGEEAVAAAEKKVREWEKLFSVNNPDSDIAQINKNAHVKVSGDTYELIQKSLVISESTNGLFDISIYPLVKAWGFTTQEYRVPDWKEQERLCKKVDFRKIRCEGGWVSIADGMALDLGGIAKGYASHNLIKLFRQMGVKSAIVSLGGNVETLGEKPDGSPFKVGIKHPLEPEKLLQTVEARSKAVVTSGSYERYFEKDGETYHHIIDKNTGAPVKNDLVSITVIADNGITADGLSTALFVAGSEKAIKMHKELGGFEIILLRRDGTVYIS